MIDWTATPPEIKETDSFRYLFSKGMCSIFFPLNLIVSLVSFIAMPMYFIEGFHLNALTFFYYAASILVLSSIFALKAKWSTGFLSVSMGLTCFVAWDNSAPTEGFWTLFYTDRQVEVFKEIESINATLDNIQATVEKTSSMTLNVDDLIPAHELNHQQ
jgi:hypothetical protein